MKNKSIYSSFIEAKTGTLIPVLVNGKTLESRYNPEAEAEKKITSINFNYDFFILIGLCSGILAEKILSKKPESTILAIETSEEDFLFLNQSPVINKIHNKIICCTPENLVQALINNYIPAFYGNLQIIENQVWCMENAEINNTIKLLINKSLDYISKDFSVQSHFGKLWQNNILNNLQLLQEYDSHLENYIIPTDKTAIVVAAGPSLDSKLQELETNRDMYFIIATDTAFSILQKKNIFCDCVISIDAQQISYNHFINNLESCKNTLFVFDLTGNHSVCKKLIENKMKVLFSINNHPFSNYINEHSNKVFPQLFSGAGTVTIGALDFAIQCGFNKIQVIGADFSYINFKPYAKGTYLDSLYSMNSNYVNSSEKTFTGLMYRTEITKINDKIIKTPVLDSYENSFLEYLKSNNAQFNKENEIYFIELSTSTRIRFKSQKTVDIKKILMEFDSENTNFTRKNSIKSLKNTDICLLPLISWLRNNENKVEDNFSELLKIAYSMILRLD